MRTLFRKLGQVGWSFPIILVLAALCIGGIFVIMSATYTNDALKNAFDAQRKYLFVGFALYLALALTPYQLLVRISPILYGIGIVLLIAVFHGSDDEHHGAKSWLRIFGFSFEPAEFAKLAFILGLAWFLNLRQDKIKHLSTVLWAALITLIPFILILKQPALGSAAVFFPVCFAMLFAAGARIYYVAVPLAVLGCGIFAAYYWFHVWNKPGYVTVFGHEIAFLKPFQADRIKIFFDPSLDKQGSAWQINQSIIAIGSGGMKGKAPWDMDTARAIVAASAGKAEVKDWMNNTQTALGYLPKDTSYNDSIFSVVGELFGFCGGAALIVGEGTVLLWCLWVAANARDKVGALVAVGVMTMLFTHIFVNIGMTIQLVPITGIPLPFISYGGTFLIACLAAMGLVQSVWVHRKNLERR